MKAILISIRPEWVEKILNGEKVIEIRKSIPNCSLPIDVYIYCSKSGKYLTRGIKGNIYPSCCISNGIQEWHLNGKVVAKFTLKETSEFSCEFNEDELFAENSAYQGITLVVRDNDYPNNEDEIEYFYIKTSNEEGFNDQEVVEKSKFLRKSCLTLTQLKDYVGIGFDKRIFAWNIDNLEIFDKPKVLSEFEKQGSFNNKSVKCKKKEIGQCNFGYSPYTGKWCGCEKAKLTKAPQSWCYIEV